ncbi:MAG: 1-deoxy-D-xylulose-5-phosphate reductoisomerase [Elusimicrobia bacterium]|nr:1-deoxy-D-xylulose-5-phosphate reductoisomerase [Elusimicrobiota bacterium]
MTKRIAILGSTGSIGENALEVLEKLGPDYQVIGLSANKNAQKLLQQTIKFKPKWISLHDPEASDCLRAKLTGHPKLLPPGVEGLAELASQPEVDLVLTSLVGGMGLLPLLTAIKAGKSIALANKEPMVMAGEFLMKEAQRWNAQILPVDSEPSAIFQCLQNHKLTTHDPQLATLISKIWLTASGGPFYRKKRSLDRVTPKEALAHPNWKMGKKISIDSATLMNKGFETIEIKNLFGLHLDQIEVVIHPQSVMHSAVEFQDGSVLAQMSPPDMRLPIQYAITYPERKQSPAEHLNFFSVKRLDFDKPDFRRFPCLALALEAARIGGTLPTVLSAADEIVVEAFLKEQIRFTDIPKIIERIMRFCQQPSRTPSLSEIVEVDGWARQKTLEILKNKC